MGGVVLCSLLALCSPSPAATVASASIEAPVALPQQAAAVSAPAPQLSEPAEDRSVEIEVEVIGTHEWPAKVDTVTTEQIDRMVNAPYVSDVLERIPGADTLTGCPAGAPLITIRGNNSEWTQVLLEGIPINPIGRPYVLNFVPMSAVDTVRILKGPTPPRYPGTTIAGLVLLEMKTGDRYPGLELSGTIGDYGQRLLNASLGGGDSSRSYFLSLTRSQMDGWLPHCDMALNNAAAKIVVTPDARSKLSLVGSHFWGDKFGPRPDGPNPANKWAAEWTDISQPKASLTYERDLSENSDLMIRIAPYRFSGTQKWDQWFADHEEQRFMPWEYQLLRTEVQHDVRTGLDRIWTWGGSWQSDLYRYAGPLALRFWEAVPADRWREFDKRAGSLYLQHSFPTRPGDTLTLGGRYDTEDPARSAVSPFFSWHGRLTPTTRLRLALTRSRRFPKLMELYGQGMWVGNPALQPELGWTYQADLSRALGSSSVELSLFESSLDDLIVADETNVFTNLGEARIRGIELSWQDTWRLGSCYANYTYLDAWDTLNDRPLVVAFRTAYPKHSAKAGVVIEDSAGGEHAVELLAYGPRRTDVDAPTYVGNPWNVIVPPRIAGFTSLNYKHTRQVHEHTKLSFAVENILGTEAQDLLFYPRPGRWLSCTLSHQLR